jgi:transcriptional regulator with GAF, ATPase, and Fis domain/serine/threonine protein kinase
MDYTQFDERETLYKTVAVYAKSYKFEELQSYNTLSQSWIAIDLKSGKKKFVKVPMAASDIGRDKIESILLNSFACQDILRSGKVLRATARHWESGNLLIEYPLLDRTDWRILTPELFWTSYPSLLLDAFIIIDFLHLLNLVHCDLKFDNFQVGTKEMAPHLILVDLDFLTRSQSHPHSKIFGTPEHIAPEIIENDIITARSDNYSIGVSLKKYLADIPDRYRDALNNNDSFKGLPALIESLTAQEPASRPRILLDALLQNGIIDGDRYNRALKTLLGMHLLSIFRREKTRLVANRQMMQRFLSAKNGLFGIHEELAGDLYQAFVASPLKTTRLFASLIRDGEIARHGDYWQVNLTDQIFEKAFEESAKIAGTKLYKSHLSGLSTSSELDAQINSVLQGLDSGDYLKSYLDLKHLLDSYDRFQDDNCRPGKRKLLIELGRLAKILGRLTEGIEFISKAVELTDFNDPLRLDLYLDLSYRFLLTQNIEGAEKVVSLGLETARLQGNPKFEIAFMRQQAWIQCVLRRDNQADEIIGKLMERVRNLGFNDEMGKILVLRGTMDWRCGDFPGAERHLLKGLALIRHHGSASDMITPLASLSALYFEFAEYEKSIRFGKMAIKLLQYSSDPYKHFSTFISIMLSLTRLGEFRKAEYWLEKYLTGKSERYNQAFFRIYYFYRGGMMHRRGDFREGKETLLKALEMFSSDSLDRNHGKIFEDLAMLTFYQGKSEECQELIRKGRILFEKMSDEASLADTDFISKIDAVYNHENANSEDLLPILEKLLKYNSRYYAILSLFYILIGCSDQTKEKSLKMAEQVMPLIRRSRVPLFRSVNILLNDENGPGRKEADSLVYLKAAFRILQRCGEKMPALLICRKMAELYLSDSKNKLARVFFLQSAKLAENIGNKGLAESLSGKARALSEEQQDQRKIFESIHGISEILKNIGNYDLALQKLVQYAVDETGAERGVLLLGTEQSPELRVKSSVNCDDESLKDIKDFSRSIPMTVARENNPVIIDNALEDERTKKYKSIIIHNILSVICVPIRMRDKSFGVLYLDHHTIPALFEKEDVTIVYSMANFISVLLSNIQEFRDISQTKIQLADDLARMGIKKPLIAGNARMKAMLSKLPEIARSNASVLICGESGTGKEILCEMIHDLSNRSRSPLIKLNCAAIASTLIESELFGVAKGSATDVGEKDGKFAAADGGTLFLDEVGDMPIEIQSKVLRVLEYQQFEKVGSNRVISTDIRFIYATNKNLRELIKTGKFREDLYYRINTITMTIPPLRERLDDIPFLLDNFLNLFSPDEMRRPIFSSDALQALMAYHWPGNVRELRNLAEKYCILYPGRKIGFIDLPREIQEYLPEDNDEHFQEMEKAKIRELLIANNWNQSKVAKILNVPLSTFRRKIKKYKISKE